MGDGPAAAHVVPGDDLPGVGRRPGQDDVGLVAKLAHQVRFGAARRRQDPVRLAEACVVPGSRRGRHEQDTIALMLGPLQSVR